MFSPSDFCDCNRNLISCSVSITAPPGLCQSKPRNEAVLQLASLAVQVLIDPKNIMSEIEVVTVEQLLQPQPEQVLVDCCNVHEESAAQFIQSVALQVWLLSFSYPYSSLGYSPSECVFIGTDFEVHCVFSFLSIASNRLATSGSASLR